MTEALHSPGWRQVLLRHLGNGKNITTALALSNVGKDKYLTERRLSPDFADKVDKATKRTTLQW